MIIITCTVAAVTKKFDAYRDFLVKNGTKICQAVARAYNIQSEEVILITQVIGRLDARMCVNVPQGLFLKLEVPMTVFKRINAHQLADHILQSTPIGAIPFSVYLPGNESLGQMSFAQRNSN